MPLEMLETEIAPLAIPADVSAFLDEADRRIAAFLRRRTDRPLYGFVPSDFGRAYAALRSVRDAHLAPGDVFCEWGSGFGVVACLAAMLGFEAYGIEIEPDLVDGARDLAEAYDLPVRFAEGTFVPPEGESVVDRATDFAWLQSGGACGYEELDLDPDELDVIFVFPWPGEEQVVADLFERFAGDGALLITYHGLEDLRLRRRARDPD